MSDNNNSSSSSNRRSLSVPVANIKNNNISDIQWAMIDKKRYFPLTVMNMFAVRTLLYPLTLIRTRLQVQARDSLYTGTINALRTVVKYEGFLALYKGFWINSFQLIPHVIYITSYEVSFFLNIYIDIYFFLNLFRHPSKKSNFISLKWSLAVYILIRLTSFKILILVV